MVSIIPRYSSFVQQLTFRITGSSKMTGLIVVVNLNSHKSTSLQCFKHFKHHFKHVNLCLIMASQGCCKGGFTL